MFCGVFQVKWSDSSSSSVTKTHRELENFLLKVHAVVELVETLSRGTAFVSGLNILFSGAVEIFFWNI